MSKGVVICPYCRSEIRPGAKVHNCRACSTPHHFECWKTNEGCSIFGCTEAPQDEELPPIDSDEPPSTPPFPANSFSPDQSFYVIRNELRFGPYAPDDLFRVLEEGQVEASDQVRAPDLDREYTVRELLETESADPTLAPMAWAGVVAALAGIAGLCLDWDEHWILLVFGAVFGHVAHFKARKKPLLRSALRLGIAAWICSDPLLLYLLID